MLAWFKPEISKYHHEIAVTWQTSVAQLTEPGRDLLERLAWLAPEKVPEFLLDVPVPGAEGENLHEALADLAAYSLVTRDAEGPFFLVHRLVQDVTKRSLTGERRAKRLTEALAWIHVAFPNDVDNIGSWPRANALAPHARAVVADADKIAISEPTSRLMNELGLLLHSKALFAEAEPLYQRALAISEKALGPEHPDIATALNNLAELYRATGRYAEAEPLYQRASRSARRRSGPTIPTSPLAQQPGLLYRRPGPLRRGRAALPARARHPREGARPRPPRRRPSLNNLAVLYRAPGPLRRGRAALPARPRIREKALGPDTPTSPLAQQPGRALPRARAATPRPSRSYKRALAIREKALGPDHPDVATSLNNLAVLYEPGPLRRGRAALRARARDLREGARTRPPRRRPEPEQPGPALIARAAMPRPSRSTSARSPSAKRH